MQNVVPEENNTFFEYSGLLICMLYWETVDNGTRDHKAIPKIPKQLSAF